MTIGALLDNNELVQTARCIMFSFIDTKIEGEIQKAQVYGQGHADKSHRPDLPYLNYIHELQVSIKLLEERINRIEKLRQQKEQENKEIYAAYDQFLPLLRHLLSGEFYEETKRLYNLKPDDQNRFTTSERIFRRLNSHLEILNDYIIGAIDDQLKMSGDTKAPQQEILINNITFLLNKVIQEDNEIISTQTKSTACLTVACSIGALAALGVVADVILGILVLASVMSLAAAAPWLFGIGLVAGLIIAAGIMGEGFRCCMVDVPQRNFAMEAFNPILNFFRPADKNSDERLVKNDVKLALASA